MNLNNFGNIRKQTAVIIKSIGQSNNFRNARLGFSVFSVEDFSGILKQKEELSVFFTDDEIVYCKNRVDSLAGRYAGKLAVREALGEQIDWKLMNILPTQTQQPIVLFNTEEAYGSVPLSITHEGNLVAAVAVYARTGGVMEVGIDAIKISRIADMLRDQANVLPRILTEREILEIRDDPVGVAKKWTGKEAVSKALGYGVWHGGVLRDIEILGGNGEPSTVVLKGRMLTRAREKLLERWKLWYIKDEEFVLALAVAVG